MRGVLVSEERRRYVQTLIRPCQGRGDRLAERLVNLCSYLGGEKNEIISTRNDGDVMRVREAGGRSEVILCGREENWVCISPSVCAFVCCLGFPEPRCQHHRLNQSINCDFPSLILSSLNDGFSPVKYYLSMKRLSRSLGIGELISLRTDT